MALSTLFVDANKSTQKLPRFSLKYSTDPQFTNNYLNKVSMWFVDASVHETYTHEAELTDNPVEQGLDVTDHYNVKPVELTMKMMHSETPIGIDSLIKGAQSAGGGFAGRTIFQNGIGNEIGAVVPGVARLLQSKSDAKTRVKTCYDLFVALMDTKSRISLQTGLSFYDNLMVRSFTVNRDKSTGQALDFSVILRQVRIIESKLIAAPKISKKPNSDRAASKTNIGQQSSKEVPAQKQSALKGLLTGKVHR